METILTTLLEEMRSLAPEVLNGLVELQAAKYALYATLWWKSLLLAIVFGGAGFTLYNAQHSEWCAGLAAVFLTAGIILLIIALVLLLLLVDYSVFNAAPEIYVLRSLLTR